MGRQVDRHVMGLTCTLLQLDAVAHVDVIYSDVAPGRVIEKPLKHHLHDRRRDRYYNRLFLYFFIMMSC